MKLFSCTGCGQTLFFDNSVCTRCGRALAFLPDVLELSALDPAPGGEAGVYVALVPAANGRRYRSCKNAVDHAVCTWAVPAELDAQAEPFCASCRLNVEIPDPSDASALAAWTKLEAAKRRVLYSLMQLGLPLETRLERPDGGLGFSFKQSTDIEAVFTGQSNGLITINIAEADDPFRERRRLELNEPYRTLLGHFRHEIGHYYWDRLIKDGPRLEAFRALFGDETASYQEALDRHYAEGPPADWSVRCVSAYASMHPWEDWAETWAHYLHMLDTMDTARAYGIALSAIGEGKIEEIASIDFADHDSFVRAWTALSIALNSLSRSMGMLDLYPFAPSPRAHEKLRFVHEVIRAHASSAFRTSAQDELGDAGGAGAAVPPAVPPPGAPPPAVPPPAAAASAPPLGSTISSS
jgi:hypothetical protein